MAVRKKAGELPRDAVILSEEDALQYQWNLITRWKPEEDVWAIRHGAAVTGICSALSGIFINNYYRNKLKLMDYGRFSTYLPIVILPAIMSTFFHQQFITNDIIIRKTACPLCVELRAGGIQSFFSTLYPTILAPISGFMFANRHYTYNVPSVVKKPAAVLALWKKMTHPIGNKLFGICAFQAFVAMVVTFYEAKSCAVIEKRLLEIERKYDEHGQNH